MYMLYIYICISRKMESEFSTISSFNVCQKFKIVCCIENVKKYKEVSYYILYIIIIMYRKKNRKALT